jgi:hypothetical protein
MKPFSTLSRPLAFLLALALLLGAVGPAAAQIFSVTFTADENGNGSFTNTLGGSGTVPSVVGSDPGPGGRSKALFYGLPSGAGLFVVGDVFVHDPSGALTDLIRFENTGPFLFSQFAFYSLPGGTDLADVAGFPTANFTNTATALENAAGLISYTPTDGQPGSNIDLPSVTYNLTSLDPAPIPEPSSLLVFGMATAGSLAWRKWRMRRRCGPPSPLAPG